MEHPMITQIMRTGYPKNMMEQPEHCGVDFFGTEILEGDDIVEHNGEIILQSNLEKYLEEELGFTFKSA